MMWSGHGHLADRFTLGNAIAGSGAIFSTITYV
jgi:hypothetical protein